MMDMGNNDINSHHEEYILLDLDAVCGQVDIPSGEPYILSGLDTLNPVLTIGDKLKLIGEYDETVGTCLIFSEKEVKNSEGNLSKGASTIDPNQDPTMRIKPVTSLQKVLRFRLVPDSDRENSPDPPFQVENSPSVS